ncbi:MAG: hypothetical protein IT384_33085 [Deltaproteobacteria bacterium]|nr:hypothetical protein [Deltaproteobacteria bacterium]
MKVTLDTFLNNQAINKPGDDEAFFGWVGPKKVLQYRMNAEQAERFAAALAKLPKRVQRGILRQLHDRQGVGGMGNPGRTALVSGRAVEIMNCAAAAAGSTARFHVIRQKPLVPLAQTGGG